MNILTILQILLKDLRKKSKKQTCFQFLNLKTGLFFCIALRGRNPFIRCLEYTTEICKRSDYVKM